MKDFNICWQWNDDLLMTKNILRAHRGNHCMYLLTRDLIAEAMWCSLAMKWSHMPQSVIDVFEGDAGNDTTPGEAIKAITKEEFLSAWHSIKMYEYEGITLFGKEGLNYVIPFPGGPCKKMVGVLETKKQSTSQIPQVNQEKAIVGLRRVIRCISQKAADDLLPFQKCSHAPYNYIPDCHATLEEDECEYEDEQEEEDQEFVFSKEISKDIMEVMSW